MSQKRYSSANSHYNSIINKCDDNRNNQRVCDIELRRKRQNMFKRDDSVEIKFIFPGD
jgi:hypothetical protein